MRQYINIINPEHFLFSDGDNFNCSITTTGMINDFLLMITDYNKGPDNDN